MFNFSPPQIFKNHVPPLGWGGGLKINSYIPSIPPYTVIILLIFCMFTIEEFSFTRQRPPPPTPDFLFINKK